MQLSSEALVDVMRVPVDGDPSCAIVPVTNLAAARTVKCDVLIVGGGTGGVAAALAAARRGRRVHLTEETDWIGGQLTAQGVSALDEHEHIEKFGGTASYYSLRHAIRDHYRPHAGAAGTRADFNPGNCWVTRLAFEPKVALAAMMALLQPHIDAGRLTLHLRSKPAAAEVEGDRISSVTAVDLEHGGAVRFCPGVVLDATELGDLLPLVGAEYASGAETVAATGEPHAQPTEPKPHCVQSFTYVLGVARRPLGEHHVIARPARYDFFRAAQPYSLRIEVHGGEIYGEESGWLSYTVFETMPGTRAGPEDVGISCRTRPFQIPLGALIPMRLRNLIAAAKNIGTTHITNGCYRLHPVEWNIGEAAGALAAFCLAQGETPAAVYGNTELRSVFQRSLVADGVPLDWVAYLQG